MSKKVKIVFTLCNDQTKHQIKIDYEKTVKNSIDLFYKKIGEKNDNKKVFLLEGENISSEDNENKAIKKYIQRNFGIDTLNVLVYDLDD